MANSSSYPHLLDTAQAARLAMITPRGIRKLADRGSIRAAHIGKEWRINTRALLEHIGLDASDVDWTQVLEG